MILALLAIVLTMALVVGLHELGHAFAARIFSVKIERISIGFGKPLLSWKSKSGCEWVWATWPLGGYVQLLNTRIKPVADKELSYCFDKKPISMRCFILLAGAAANFLTALFALTLMFMLGYPQQIALIKTITPASIAANAGLVSNERIIAVAGQQTKSWQEVGMRLIMNLGKEQVSLVASNLSRVLQQRNLNLSQVNLNQQSLLTTLGIEPQNKRELVAGESFFIALKSAFTKTMQLLTFFIVMLKQLITGKIPFSLLLGPLGLLSITVNSFSQGFALFIYFVASLSLAVGLVNLLPIPGLDGGSIVYALLEKIRGKPVSIAWEVLLHRLALIAAMLFLAQLLANDLQRKYQPALAQHQRST